eukprot:2548203-Ditylum_brightwellii.AAC.1
MQETVKEKEIEKSAYDELNLLKNSNLILQTDTAKLFKKHPGALHQYKHGSTKESKISNGQQDGNNAHSASQAEYPHLTTLVEEPGGGRHGNRSDIDHQEDNLKWTTESLDSEKQVHEIPSNKMDSAAPNQDVEQVTEVNDVLDTTTVVDKREASLVAITG